MEIRVNALKGASCSAFRPFDPLHLLSCIAELEPDLADALLDLLILVDARTGHLKPEFLDDRRAFARYRNGGMGAEELDAAILDTMEDRLRPLVEDACDLHVAGALRRFTLRHTCQDLLVLRALFEGDPVDYLHLLLHRMERMFERDDPDAYYLFLESAVETAWQETRRMLEQADPSADLTIA